MAKKHRKVSEPRQIKADNFKLINGIKPGIEKCLHAADIKTYSQLASLTPIQILSKLGKGKGYSIKRIEEEHWIEQAHELIPKKVQYKSGKKATTRPGIRLHYENFTIEFLLNEKNLARRTHVVHVQSGDADTWAGWEAEQLFHFIGRHAGVRLADTRSAISAHPKPNLLPPAPTLTQEASKAIAETVSINSPEMSQKNPELLASAAGSQSKIQILTATDDISLRTAPQQPSSTLEMTSSIETIHLMEWKIFLPNTDQSLHHLSHDQTFDVSLSLELNNVSLTETGELDCTATLYAKKLGSRNRQITGQTQKTVAFDRALILTINSAALSPGIYRLEALVTIRPAGTEIGQQTHFMSVLESGLIQVY